MPPSVLLQFQVKGSYRLRDVLLYLAWILDRSRLAPGPVDLVEDVRKALEDDAEEVPAVAAMDGTSFLL